MKRMTCFTIILVIALFVSGCGKDSTANSSSKPIELKLGTKMSAESLEGKAFEHFADLVKEKSNGEIVVKVYPAEQLGKGKTQIDNMLLGTQDMYAEGITYFDDYDSRVQVSSIPFLFRDFEHFQKYNTGEMGEDIQKKLISQGIRILNTDRNFTRGPYRVLLSTKPIKSVDDLKGLKIRSFESEFYSDAYESVGANPTVVAWTETYLAIKQNLVDAVTSPISLVWSMKFTEVAPYMTLIDEYPQDIVIAMGEDQFSELSKEQQDILIEAANQAGADAAEKLESEVEEQIGLMKEEHNMEIFEIDKDEWVDAFSDFHQELDDTGVFPEGYIDKIQAIE
ncbi:TRAP transporter substrate-binding protein [Virgibacillus dakarensis]|uniref:TRAP transporter substrate-binding protein n=1 Tax=Virgibacillus dakarensis TaxID=1917889 RepID=UPI000B44F19F|nr:TRAP transporter substrate-binding protein [Virgibacillus dakarensis]